MKEQAVLVIEDELLVGLDAVCQLQRAGFGTVEHAATEDEALDMLQARTWDVVVADANLNGRGIEQIVAVLHERDLPFAIVSGYGREALPALIGNAPVLGKPVSYAQLVQTVRDLCGLA